MRMIPSAEKIPKRKHKSISSFILKSYNLLNDQQNYHIVRWSLNGIGFVVLNEDHFAKTILPKYFKHSNYSSFVRQLNMYNFHKIRESDGQSYFHHEHFDRDNKNALFEIKRKPEKKKKKSIQEDDSLIDEKASEDINHPQNKDNLKIQIYTPVSFSKSVNSKMLSENNQSTLLKEKLRIPQKKISNVRRQLFSSQMTIRLQNSVSEQNSLKRMNEELWVGEQDEDKISINDQIEEENMVTFPTKQLMYPSKNNLFPFSLKDNGSFDMLF